MQRRKWMCLAFFGATAATVTAVGVQQAMATPAVGFVGTQIALGRLGDINILNSMVQAGAPPWLTLEFTKGQSDLYVINNVWQPGGNTGWHSHPGHSLIIVTSGTLTDYEASDPNCKPVVYTTGQAFIDPGGDEVHNIRNETGATATNIAIQLIPAGATRRIDEPQPGNCPTFPAF